jgi:hypothetical protein
LNLTESTIIIIIVDVYSHSMGTEWLHIFDNAIIEKQNVRKHYMKKKWWISVQKTVIHHKFFEPGFKVDYFFFAQIFENFEDIKKILFCQMYIIWKILSSGFLKHKFFLMNIGNDKENKNSTRNCSWKYFTK